MGPPTPPSPQRRYDPCDQSLSGPTQTQLGWSNSKHMPMAAAVHRRPTDTLGTADLFDYFNGMVAAHRENHGNPLRTCANVTRAVSRIPSNFGVPALYWTYL
jgi:hypothetical protein